MYVDAPPRRPTLVLAFPCALIALAVATASGATDYRVSGLFFDDVSGTFPLRSHWALELLGHHFGKSLVVLVWMVLLCLGRCFPAGHSAGGFSLFAFVFAAWTIGRPRNAAIAFVVAMTVGAIFSGVRIAQGAYFLSHTLWAAAIDWIACGLVFLWFQPASPDDSKVNF